METGQTDVIVPVVRSLLSVCACVCVPLSLFLTVQYLFVGGLQMQSIKRANYTIGATWSRAVFRKFGSVVEMVPFCIRRRADAKCMVHLPSIQVQR
jgi:hypothetical protein